MTENMKTKCYHCDSEVFEVYKGETWYCPKCECYLDKEDVYFEKPKKHNKMRKI